MQICAILVNEEEWKKINWIITLRYHTKWAIYFIISMIWPLPQRFLIVLIYFNPTHLSISNNFHSLCVFIYLFIFNSIGKRMRIFVIMPQEKVAHKNTRFIFSIILPTHWEQKHTQIEIGNKFFFHLHSTKLFPCVHAIEFFFCLSLNGKEEDTHTAITTNTITVTIKEIVSNFFCLIKL